MVVNTSSRDSLPAEAVSCSTVNAFKSKIDPIAHTRDLASTVPISGVKFFFSSAFSFSRFSVKMSRGFAYFALQKKEGIIIYIV